MKVSVVVLAFNEEDYIADCLTALQQQTEPVDEVIVVDNNSTDRTGEIARSLGARVIVEKEQGITPARNTGFNAAHYDIIARCDADTRPFKDWIARIKQNFADPELLGVTGTNEFYDAPVELKSIYEKIFTLAYFGGNRKLLGHEAFYGSNMALRRQVWLEVRDEVCNNDLLVHEDIDLAIHIAARGRIRYDPRLMVACSFRVMRVDLGTLYERMAKWPRSKLVHTRLKPLLRPGKKPSSSAQNRRKKPTVTP